MQTSSAGTNFKDDWHKNTTIHWRHFELPLIAFNCLIFLKIFISPDKLKQISKYYKLIQ